ncbi:MAG: hypothetical protein ACON38_08880 [Akkermansiaceae bacterium]
MTDREKNLLIVLGVAFFVIANLIAFNMFYTPKVTEAKRAKADAESNLRQQQSILAREDELAPAIRWLAATGNVVTTPQLAQSQLRSYLRKQADARGLETRNEQILGYIEGYNYDRVRVQYKCTGMEDRIIQWLLTIHQPRQRQVVTKLEIKPQNNDLTRVEITVEVEKWIITSDENADPVP